MPRFDPYQNSHHFLFSLPLAVIFEDHSKADDFLEIEDDEGNSGDWLIEESIIIGECELSQGIIDDDYIPDSIYNTDSEEMIYNVEVTYNDQWIDGAYVNDAEKQKMKLSKKQQWNILNYIRENFDYTSTDYIQADEIE